MIKKILSYIREDGLLYKAIQQGITPKDLKNEIIEVLNPYFENKQILEKFSIEILVPQFICFLKMSEDDWSFAIFQKYYENFKEAKRADREKCFASFSYWHQEIMDAISRFWSIFSLELDKNKLPDTEKVFECFRNIGDIIEGLTKPYLKNLLCQIRVINKSTPSFQEIGNLDLGKIVNQLVKTTGFPELFSPPPLRIKINQWRNIAYHHNFKLVNDVILLWYGKGGNRKELTIHKNDILQIATVISNCHKLHKLAYDLFFIDNVEAIKKYLPDDDYEMRFESLFGIIALGIASQGFDIISLDRDIHEAKLIIKDLTDLNTDERFIHGSQFLYPLWRLTKSHKLIVEYWDSGGKPKVLFNIDSDICEKVYRSEIDFHEIAAKMNIIFLKNSK